MVKPKSSFWHPQYSLEKHDTLFHSTPSYNSSNAFLAWAGCCQTSKTVFMFVLFCLVDCFCFCVKNKQNSVVLAEDMEMSREHWYTHQEWVKSNSDFIYGSAVYTPINVPNYGTLQQKLANQKSWCSSVSGCCSCCGQMLNGVFYFCGFC